MWENEKACADNAQPLYSFQVRAEFPSKGIYSWYLYLLTRIIHRRIKERANRLRFVEFLILWIAILMCPEYKKKKKKKTFANSISWLSNALSKITNNAQIHSFLFWSLLFSRCVLWSSSGIYLACYSVYPFINNLSRGIKYALLEYC